MFSPLATRPHFPPLSPAQSSTAAPNRGTAAVAFADWVEAETAAGRPVTASEHRLWGVLSRLAFEPNGRRAGPGRLEVWHSDLMKATGLGRTAVAAAMRRFRRAGLLEGAPCPPDPGNDFYRERAVYRLTIPEACKQVLARLAYKARRLFDEARSRVAPPSVRAVVTPREILKPLGTGPVGLVDDRRGLPADYLEARRRLRAGR